MRERHHPYSASSVRARAPRMWRLLSSAQRRFIDQCIRNGPQIVTAKTRRTAEVLLCRWLMVEYLGPNTWIGPPRRPNAGSVLRATGKAWEIYRATHVLEIYRALPGDEA